MTLDGCPCSLGFYSDGRPVFMVSGIFCGSDIWLRRSGGNDVGREPGRGTEKGRLSEKQAYGNRAPAVLVYLIKFCGTTFTPV